MRMVVSVCRTMCAYLQVSVGTRPRQHTLPSCGSDTRGACDAVADVVGEACDCHCVALVCVLDSDIGPPAHVSAIHDDGEQCDNECPFHVVSPCVVVRVYCTKYAHRRQPYHGCRIASPTPIMARGISIAVSIAIVMISIVLPLLANVVGIPLCLDCQLLTDVVSEDSTLTSGLID